MSAPAFDPQRIAADPKLSAFVTANAGSGKTKTLIDRAARLLLQGANPDAILCVTYTKAAAAEVQRRLFQTLGRWAVAGDDELKQALHALDGAPVEQMTDEDLSRARVLFARALETPGGLKIQTIHAFCEKLLRRFPIEAGLSPGFEVMDDPAAAAIAARARDAVARLVEHRGGVAAEAYARMAISLDLQAFEGLFRTFEGERGALADYFDRHGGLAGAVADVWSVCGFKDGRVAPADILAEAWGETDEQLWRAAVAVLLAGGKTDQGCGQKLSAALSDADIEQAIGVFFTAGGSGTPATWVARSSAFKFREELREDLLREQDRLERVRQRLRAAKVAEDTTYVLALAEAYVQSYEIEKRAAGALDFADLIDRVRALLTETGAASWVLFKLDYGLDHILLDEAQDTAPEQWAILDALADEFFSGHGARPRERTLFVVGDEKQSIYSFQGADPAQLLIQTQRYLGLIQASRKTGEAVTLATSYRSTVEVLSFVDALFEPAETRSGVPPPMGEDVVRHIPFRADHAGCVDLWEPVQEEAGHEREAWDDPVDLEPAASANKRLAARIAAEIEALVARGDAVFDKDARAWRPANFGDVLILVRRRRALFEEIIRELKRRGVPVAGADRLALSAHIAFDDLLALARFCLFPEDELTLAALLRSPFCDLSDDDLYALAHGRGKTTLWRVLGARADERPAWRAAHDFLAWARSQAQARRPFEFYNRVLGRAGMDGRSMRARLLTRLGAEAADVIDGFLAQVLAAEQRGVNDLERLAHGLASLDIALKRELEDGRGEVRVMTAHGAKGLEAPIVFLPETTLTQTARGSALMRTEAGGFLWCPRQADDCDPSAEARAWRRRKEEEEALRLLYVSLTRARDRLVIGGRIGVRDKPEEIGGWYGAAVQAFQHETVAGRVRELQGPDYAFKRYGPDPTILGEARAVVSAAAALPDWLARPAPAEAEAARFAAPSSAAEATKGAAPSPLAVIDGIGRFRRGEIIHRLLQFLPDVEPSERRAAAARLLARERDLSEGQRAEMEEAAFGVLDDPVFAPVFGPGSRAEAALAGGAASLPGGLAISGRMDRLVVAEDRVLVVDFKTNRPAPARIEDADPAYLIQMATYAAVLGEVFPGRRIEAALVWTDGPRLMPVPEKVMADALAGLAARG